MSKAKYLSTAEAAQRLGISDSLMRRWCREGRLGQRVGRAFIISEKDLERFQKARREPGRPVSVRA